MEAHAEDLPKGSAVIRTGVGSEPIAILAVVVMLGGLVFTTASWSREDIRNVRDDVRILGDGVRILRDDVQDVRGNLGTLRGEFDSLRGEFDLLHGEVRDVQSGLSDLRERVARIETLLKERSDVRPGQ